MSIRKGIKKQEQFPPIGMGFSPFNKKVNHNWL